MCMLVVGSPYGYSVIEQSEVGGTWKQWVKLLLRSVWTICLSTTKFVLPLPSFVLPLRSVCGFIGFALRCICIPSCSSLRVCIQLHSRTTLQGSKYSYIAFLWLLLSLTAEWACGGLYSVVNYCCTEVQL